MVCGQRSTVNQQGGKNSRPNKSIQSFDPPNFLDTRRYLNVTQEIDPT
jgi:hypothetical protein